MKLQAAALVFCAWMITGIGVLHGQQAFGNEFALNNPIHLEGTIAKLEWANPRVYLDIAIPDANGRTTSCR